MQTNVFEFSYKINQLDSKTLFKKCVFANYSIFFVRFFFELITIYSRNYLLQTNIKMHFQKFKNLSKLKINVFLSIFKKFSRIFHIIIFEIV